LKLGFSAQIQNVTQMYVLLNYEIYSETYFDRMGPNKAGM